MFTLIAVVLLVGLVAATCGYYFYKKHQRMLAAMSPEQRELYEAEQEYKRELYKVEKEHKRSVAKAERELREATDKHEADVRSAEKTLEKARKQGQDCLGTYQVRDKTVELWQDRVRVPLPDESQKEHHFKDGPVTAKVDTVSNLVMGEQVVDIPEIYLTIEGPDFASLVKGQPLNGPTAHEFATKINHVSKSFHSVLQAREQAISEAQRKLEAAKDDRAAIEAATEKLATARDTKKLEAARNNTRRVDAARNKVAETAQSAPREHPTL